MKDAKSGPPTPPPSDLRRFTCSTEASPHCAAPRNYDAGCRRRKISASHRPGRQRTHARRRPPPSAGTYSMNQRRQKVFQERRRKNTHARNVRGAREISSTGDLERCAWAWRVTLARDRVPTCRRCTRASSSCSTTWSSTSYCVDGRSRM